MIEPGPIAADRKLLVIQTCAGLAQWLDIFLIFSVPSFIWKADPAQIATLASFFGLPGLFLGPVFGAFLDRNDPRKLMFAGAIARTVFSIVIASAASFELFAVLVLAKGLSNLLYWPASNVLANRFVAQERRVSFFSNLSALDQLGKVTTPLIAGALAVLVPMQVLFYASATATCICALLLLSLPAEIEAPVQSRRSFGGLVSDLVNGLASYPRLPRDLKIGICLGVSMSLVLAIYDPHLAAFLNSQGFRATAFSTVVSATAAGAIGAASAVRIFWASASAAALIRSGVLCFAAALLCATYFAWVRPELLSVGMLAALWFVNGFGYELFAIGSSVNMQNLCPREALGRISTSQRSMQLTAVVLGPALGAWLIRESGRSTPFLISSLLAVAAACAVLLWRPMKPEVSVQSA